MSRNLSQQKDYQLLDLVAGIMEQADLDEHEGDWMERAETVLFIATRGRVGRDWGHLPAPPGKRAEDMAPTFGGIGDYDDEEEGEHA